MGATERVLWSTPCLPKRSQTVPIVLALRMMARKPGLELRRVQIAVWNELHFTKTLAKRETPEPGVPALGGAC